jgi:hypothetical protein
VSRSVLPGEAIGQPMSLFVGLAIARLAAGVIYVAPAVTINPHSVPSQ